MLTRLKLLTFVLIVSFGLALLAPAALAKDDSSEQRLMQVRQAIQKTKARWKADANPISRLPMAAQRKLLGWIPSPTSDLYTADIEQLDGTTYTAALPASFDWRNVNGNSYVTPVKRQRCGDCWAFAAIGALEARQAIDGTSNEDLSEQLLVSSCCNTGSCSGGYIVSTSQFIRDSGSPDEACYPYLGRDSSCNQACSSWREAARQVSSYTRVSQTATALKSALYTHGPINVGMMVYSDFSSYSSGIYEHAYGQQEGGHAVLIVGYDDDQQCFIVKNSWGTDWGENGFFRIAYSQVDGVVDFGAEACVYGDEIDHDDDPDPEPDPEPDNALENGEVVTDLASARGQWQYYTIAVSEGASDLMIAIEGGSGDADLYVNFGSQPSLRDFDCRPYRWGNVETCSFPAPSAGTYHIGLYSYEAYAGLDLSASFAEDGSSLGADVNLLLQGTKAWRQTTPPVEFNTPGSERVGSKNE